MNRVLGLLASAAVAIPLTVADKPTLFLVGDSTVKVGTKGQQGWGDPVLQALRPGEDRGREPRDRRAE